MSRGKTFGIWFDFKIQPDNEWIILFERLIKAGIKECFINANVEQLEYLISFCLLYTSDAADE